MTIKNLKDLQTTDEKGAAKSIVFNEEKSKVIVFNLLPGQVLPKHGHPKRNAYVIVINGEGTCYLDDADSGIGTGDIVHCNSEQTISIENTGTALLTFYVVLAEE